MNLPELADLMTFGAVKTLWRQDLAATRAKNKREKEGIGDAYFALRLRLRRCRKEVRCAVGSQEHQLHTMLFCLRRPDIAHRIAGQRHLVEMLGAVGYLIEPELFMSAPEEVSLIITGLLRGYREDIPASAYPVIDRIRAAELAGVAAKARASWSERVRLLPVLSFLSPEQLEILRREIAYDPALPWTLLKWNSAWARSGLPSRLYHVGCQREVVESMLRAARVPPRFEDDASLPRFLQTVGKLGMSRWQPEQKGPQTLQRDVYSLPILSGRKPALWVEQFLNDRGELLKYLTDEPTARLLEPVHCVIRFAVDAFPGLERWLMREVDEGRGYVLALCFHLAARALEDGRKDLASFASPTPPTLFAYQRYASQWWAFLENLQTWDREKLLSCLARSEVTRGEVRALHKLTRDMTGPWPDDTTFDQLIRVIRSRTKGKAVRHLKDLNRVQVKALLELPDDVCPTNVVRLLGEQASGTESLIQRTLWLTRFSPSANVRRLASGLRNIRTWESLENALLTWAEDLQFPLPPFNSPTNNLLPLDSPKAMIREAYKQRKCLAHLIGDVLNGHAYFYRFEDVLGTIWTLRFILVRSTQGDISRWVLSQAEKEGSQPATSEEFGEIEVVVSDYLKDQLAVRN
ncbi:MAG: hypothetical protein RIB80_02885 [Rhodospirillales bacterium]